MKPAKAQASAPLSHYAKSFAKLRVDRTHGVAPHKPVLLISVLQAVKAGLLTDNKIHITTELVALFKANWNILVETSHSCKFALPFFHLRSSGFWRLQERNGSEVPLQSAGSISSIGQLDRLVAYAEMDEALFTLMQDEESNTLLTQVLLQTWFNRSQLSESSAIRNYQLKISVLEDKILNEAPQDYKLEIDALLGQKDDEEIFLRGSVFKKQIPRIYNNTCCISGLKIDSKLSFSMIDACHIRSFSESHDDTITNGISLCPNLHRAFDRGIISINNDYKVMVSPLFTEDDNVYGIRQFENKSILLPLKEEHRPFISNLEWHRENIFEY